MISTSTDWITEALAPLPAIATAKEAAAVLRTTPRNLRRLIVSGRLTAIRATERETSRVLVPRAAIEAYLRAASSTAPEAPVTRIKLAPKPTRKAVRA